MSDWIDRFRSSVDWEDQVIAYLLPEGTPSCLVQLSDGPQVWVHGLLADLPGAVGRARLARESLDCSNIACRGVTVMFLDEQATAAQVEEACYVLARAGFSCDFLEVQPRVLRDGLLLRMSEGTVLDGPPRSDA